MVGRLVSLLGVACASGCWNEEPLIHGAFTADQWAHLQKQYRPPEAPDPCDLPPPRGNASKLDCDAAARLGQKLFFEPSLSGPWIVGGGSRYPAGQTSCATCHDAVPNKAMGWYIDTREHNAVSQGAVYPTPHNTITIVNVHVGDREVFTWTGQCRTPIDVIRDIALPKAMASDAAIVGRAMRWVPGYLPWYRAAFGDDAPIDDASLQANVEIALDAYMRRVISIDSPFDHFMRGNDSAIDDSAKRGFALFVGRAMCAECHRGTLLTDEAPHVTGVIDDELDKGHQGSGGFFTPGLRNVANTGPYMHNGSLATLADVIELYRWGGAASGYVGIKDPLMAPLDITDDEAKDLEHFLHALTGENIILALRQDTHLVVPPAMTCTLDSSSPGLVCGGMCRDVLNDRLNCGSCGNTCSSYCMGGVCGP